MAKKSSIAHVRNQAIPPKQYDQLFDQAQAQLARRDAVGALDTCQRILGRLPKKAQGVAMYCISWASPTRSLSVSSFPTRF